MTLTAIIRVLKYWSKRWVMSIIKIIDKIICNLINWLKDENILLNSVSDREIRMSTESFRDLYNWMNI